MNLNSLFTGNEATIKRILTHIHALTGHEDYETFHSLLHVYLNDLREMNDTESDMDEIRIRQGKIEATKAILNLFDTANKSLKEIYHKDNGQQNLRQ